MVGSDEVWSVTWLYNPGLPLFSSSFSDFVLAPSIVMTRLARRSEGIWSHGKLVLEYGVYGDIRGLDGLSGSGSFVIIGHQIGIPRRRTADEKQAFYFGCHFTLVPFTAFMRYNPHTQS